MKTEKFVDKTYRLTRNAAPLSYMLPTRHTNRFPLLHFDDETGVNRELRYARNQKSIYVDEQDGHVVLEPIIFEDGFLMASELEVDALIEARQLSLDQVESISRVLFNHNVAKMSTAELKRDILVYARNHPEEFLNVVSDPDLKHQSRVQQFFEEGLLVEKKAGAIHFNTKANKKRMLTVPMGEDVNMIVSAYLKSDDGIESLKLLEKILNKDE